MSRYIYYISQIGIFLLLLCCLPAISISETTDKSIVGQEDNDFDTSFDTSGVRMIASLLAVLGLIFGGVYLLKKLTPYKGLISNTEHSISVLSRMSLGQKRSICLVKIAGEILVIGLTNSNISVLSKMDADEYYSKNESDTHRTPAEYRPSFSKILSKIGIKNNRTSTAQDEAL